MTDLRKMAGNAWRWAGISDATIRNRSHDNPLTEVRAIKTCGNYYEIVKLKEEDRVPFQGNLHPVGIQPLLNYNQDTNEWEIERLLEVYANEDGSEWTVWEPVVDVDE